MFFGNVLYCSIVYTIRNKYIQMAESTPIITIKVTFADQVRSLSIDGHIDITGKERGSVYTSACRAFPEAFFITQKTNGRVYLIRTG